ncbi:MAG: hypothetical protein LCH87_16040 [Actinobacteria bacterium]|nr:hypothetical protein [Actinomycetota bacterium]
MSERAFADRGTSRIHDDGSFRAGDVVVASVQNPIENPSCKGKRRPFVLVHRVNGHWRGMGLTTSSHYADGTPRIAIPNPASVGLHRAGYLWGDRPTSVCALDVDTLLGVVDASLAEAVISLAGLRTADAAALREAAGLPTSGTAA